MPRLMLCAAAAVAMLFPMFSSAAEQPADIDIHFVPQNQFATYVSGYVPGNIGFFCLHWNGTGACTRATVLIACDVTNQAERVHAIREELTQAMGLMEDSWTYPDSMFYQGWTPGVQYAEIDKTLIRMLYRTDIRPNMTSQQAHAVLAGHYSQREVDYFSEIAFGSEYTTNDEPVHKWLHSPTVQVSGQATDVDIRTLSQVIKELNELIGKIQLKVVKWGVTPVKKA